VLVLGVIGWCCSVVLQPTGRVSFGGFAKASAAPEPTGGGKHDAFRGTGGPYPCCRLSALTSASVGLYRASTRSASRYTPASDFGGLDRVRTASGKTGRCDQLCIRRFRTEAFAP